jgi:hypothetical protein
VGKDGLRETEKVVNENDKLVTWEGVVRLGAGNDSDPRVCGGTKLHLLTFENEGKD